MERGRRNRLGSAVLYGRLRERWQQRLRCAAAATLWLHLFLLMLGLTAAHSASAALFLESHDERGLALVFVLGAIALLFGQHILDRLVTRYGVDRATQATVLLMAFGVMAFRLQPDAPSSIARGLLYLWVEVGGVLAVLQFWSLARGFVASTRARRWHIVIGSGGFAGLIAAGLLTRAMADAHVPVLILLAGVVMLPAAALVPLFRRLSQALEATMQSGNRLGGVAHIQVVPAQKPGSSKRPGFCSNAFTSWQSLRQWPVPVAGSAAAMMFTATVCDFYFKSLADEICAHNAESLVRLFGSYYLAVGIVGLPCSWIAGLWLSRYARTLPGLMLVPLAIGFLGLANMLWPSLFLAAVLRIGDSTFRYTSKQNGLHESCDGFAGRLGQLLGAACLLIAALLFPHHVIFVSLLLLCLAVFAWLLMLGWQAFPFPKASKTVVSPPPILLRIPVDIDSEPPPCKGTLAASISPSAGI